MTPQQFRFLLVINQILMVCLHVVAGMTEGLLPPELRAADTASVFDTALAPVTDRARAADLFVVAVDFLTFVAAAGLFAGRRWGRTLYLLCVVAMAVSPFSPPFYVSTWWDGLFGYLYGITQGAILSLVYFSHLRRLFERKRQKQDDEADEAA
jgi:hypothetical protein